MSNLRYLLILLIMLSASANAQQSSQTMSCASFVAAMQAQGYQTTCGACVTLTIYYDYYGQATSLKCTDCGSDNCNNNELINESVNCNLGDVGCSSSIIGLIIALIILAIIILAIVALCMCIAARKKKNTNGDGQYLAHGQVYTGQPANQLQPGYYQPPPPIGVPPPQQQTYQ